jgi:hypothetical protein
MLGNIPPILWLLLQLGCLSPLAIHPLWASLPLHPSFRLSPTSPICQVLVGISFDVFMALFPLLSSNLFSELIWGYPVLYSGIHSPFSFC